LISPKGIPARIVRYAEGERYRLVVSERLLAELEGVLRREKFRRYFPEEVVPAFLKRLREIALISQEEGVIEPVTVDPKDDYLFALTRSTSADYLVSGDPHLLEVQERQRYIAPIIVSPRVFLEDLDRVV
jgi:putative PIN family toxin of toxin-antitoxin system